MSKGRLFLFTVCTFLLISMNAYASEEIGLPLSQKPSISINQHEEPYQPSAGEFTGGAGAPQNEQKLSPKQQFMRGDFEPTVAPKKEKSFRDLVIKSIKALVIAIVSFIILVFLIAIIRKLRSRSNLPAFKSETGTRREEKEPETISEAVSSFIKRNIKR